MFILLQISLYSFNIKSSDQLYLQMAMTLTASLINAASDKKNLKIKSMLDEQMFPWAIPKEKINKTTSGVFKDVWNHGSDPVLRSAL